MNVLSIDNTGFTGHSRFIWWYCAVLFCAGILYTAGCAPGLLWQDSGLIQYRVLHGDIRGIFGLALSHPLFYLIASAVKTVPLGNLFWRINMTAAFFACITVANLYLFMRLFLGRHLPAVITALSLGLAHSFWRHSCIAETYTLWSALFTTELLFLLIYIRSHKRYWLYALALVNGLALSVHMLAVISLLCYVIYIICITGKHGLKVRHILFIVSLWVLGALPYEILFIQQWISTGDFSSTLCSALFGDRWQDDVLNMSISGKIIKENILFLILNFPTPNILLFFAGIYGLFRVSMAKSLRRIIMALAVLYLLFAFRYTVADRYAFFIPFYIIFALLMGVGVYIIQNRFTGILVIVLSIIPIFIYLNAPVWARQMNFSLGTRNDIAFRNDYDYFLKPWKTGQNSAEQFARTALDQVSANALIYADMTTVTPLLITQQINKYRIDVSLISELLSSPDAPVLNADTVAGLLQERDIYVVSYKKGNCPGFIRNNYRFVRSGILWQVCE